MSYLDDVLSGKDMFVTPRHNRWLAEGAAIDLEAARSVAGHMTADATGRRTSGAGRLRGSMLGRCVRAQRYSYDGAPAEQPGASSLQMMNAGTFSHYRWQVAGLSAGWLADVEVPLRADELRFRGQADGVCADGSVFELKTKYYQYAANWQGIRKAPVASDVVQLQAYMYANDSQWGSLVYENSTSLEFVEHRVPADPEMVDRLHAIAAAMDTPELPPVLPDCRSREGTEFRYCSFTQVCRPWETPFDLTVNDLLED